MKFPHFLFAFALLLSGSISASAQFDPFADPPKNMQAPTGALNPQNVSDGISVPTPPPPPGFGTEEMPKTDGSIIEYTGKLTRAESDSKNSEDGLNHYILKTETEDVQMNTTKDLDMFVGQQVTVYTEKVGDTLSIKSLTVSEGAVDDFLENVDQYEDSPDAGMVKSPETASTGPKVWIVALFSLLLLAGGSIFALRRKKKPIPIEAEKEDLF